jgi:hypothetical protein
MGYVLESADAPSEALAMVRMCGATQLGGLRPAVVIADLDAAAEDPVKTMRDLGYAWHIVLESPSPGGEAARFYANYAVILPEWRGNTMFFRDHATFLHALHWCDAVLRQVYFGPAEEAD